MGLLCSAMCGDRGMPREGEGVLVLSSATAAQREGEAEEPACRETSEGGGMN